MQEKEIELRKEIKIDTYEMREEGDKWKKGQIKSLRTELLA